VCFASVYLVLRLPGDTCRCIDGECTKILTGAVTVNENPLRISLNVGDGFRNKNLQIAMDPIEEIVHVREDVQTFGFG
jgi:hypothetical protein